MQQPNDMVQMDILGPFYLIKVKGIISLPVWMIAPEK